MNDFDFRQIASRCGSQNGAFEELCCQLAHRTLPSIVSYTRLRGDGGDGGVECFADLLDGTRIGWQAKYLFDIDFLISQATKSLTTALSIHPTLNHYIVCFPFNLTGPTSRRGRSGQEKFDDWKKEYEDKVNSKSRKLTIEAWPESKLRSLLIEHDKAGGIREFFFNYTVLSPEWFFSNLESAKVTAGPRYTPELNVETDLWKWFNAFGQTIVWSRFLENKNRDCRKAHEALIYALSKNKLDQAVPPWPDELRENAESIVSEIKLILDKFSEVSKTVDSYKYKEYIAQIEELLEHLRYLEVKLIEDLEAEHGTGRIDSPGFRQFMAEYQCSFPTANLDDVRDAINAFLELKNWLKSPSCSLAFKDTFVLTGVAGSGKTHGICDMAFRRFSEGLLTCVTFGHIFRGEPDPWTRLLEAFGLPITLGMNGFLDALNSAAEASGSFLIFCIDAINETRPLQYWRERLNPFIQAIQRRPFLRLCVTCRTSFVPYCLPESNSLEIVEHTGFKGIEREACKAFFQYYDLEPPIAPMLQPELTNPLYLKLVCKTLFSRNLKQLPTGWIGLASAIKGFLDEKEKRFAVEHEISSGANIVIGSLRAISRAIADSLDSSLSWSRAQQVVIEVRPQTNGLPIIEWLIREDLLIEDAPDTYDPLGDESTVRPAFERFGDFLIASEMIARIDSTQINSAFLPGGIMYSLFSDPSTVGQNSGVIGALSILTPEQFPGKELPTLMENVDVRNEVLKITINSIPLRDPNTFSPVSRFLVRTALGLKDFSAETMDALLSVSWQSSSIDAIYLDELLKRSSLAKRDAFWCGYLHECYESFGPVRRLIDAGFELPLNQVQTDIAERWAIVLLWFTAAANRRVKDRATRTVIAILNVQPKIIYDLMQRMFKSDDEEIRERTLLVCYGALIITRDVDVVRKTTKFLFDSFCSNPVLFNNALIRDHLRCFAELALELEILPNEYDPELTIKTITSDWPLEIPSEEQIKNWDKLPKLAYSCLEDDFYVYSIACLNEWEHALSKKEMGKWILQQVARGFAYEGSGCENYDRYMLAKYGMGRSKPVWAERIGKKYQWIAMYQLASHLFDHVERKRDSWAPKPQRTPMILLEERKLDPTLPPKIIDRNSKADVWWIGSSADLHSGEMLSHTEWIKKEDDLPSLMDLLSVKEQRGQQWQLLETYTTWGTRDEDSDGNKPYRQVWIIIHSYLIPKSEIEIAYNCIHCRNFFGQWMPEGATWSYGFAGEYPWGTPFNIEPDEWHSRGGFGKDFPITFKPSWNELSVEWEYDASLPERFHMILPARAFFTPHDLWWNGQGGYKLLNGRTVFQDPSILETGPAALLADANDILDRLDKIGFRLIWTMLGEKWILGSSDDNRIPGRIFSQIAQLEENGTIKLGERVFFDNYNKDAGPLVIKVGKSGNKSNEKT